MMGKQVHSIYLITHQELVEAKLIRRAKTILILIVIEAIRQKVYKKSMVLA